MVAARRWPSPFDPDRLVAYVGLNPKGPSGEHHALTPRVLPQLATGQAGGCPGLLRLSFARRLDVLADDLR
jgi:hypothetical protein